MLKRLANLLGWWRALPPRAAYAFLPPIVGRRAAFSAASERISRCGGHLGIYARQAFYRRALAHCGRNVYFGFGCLLSKPETCIADRVYIGRYCMIGLAKIGCEAMLADGVQVLSGRHQHGRAVGTGWPARRRDQPRQYHEVTIGDGAWIGAGAVVMADVGAQAVVGAGAVVVHPVAPGACVVGVPARPVTRARAA